MVINNLVDAVAKFCESTLANLMQPAPDKVTEIRPGSLNRTELISEKTEKSEASYKRISIFKGCLPPKGRVKTMIILLFWLFLLQEQ